MFLIYQFTKIWSVARFLCSSTASYVQCPNERRTCNCSAQISVLPRPWLSGPVKA